MHECFLLVLCLLGVFLCSGDVFFFYITEDPIDPEILVFVFPDNFFIFVKEWTGILSADYPLLVALNCLMNSNLLFLES